MFDVHWLLLMMALGALAGLVSGLVAGALFHSAWLDWRLGQRRVRDGEGH